LIIDRRNPWLLLGADVAAIAMIIAVMSTVPWLDPGSFQGRGFAVGMVLVWCLGLGLLILGAMRRHGSRFRWRTPVILAAAGAAYFGACQIVLPFIPTIIVGGSIAGMMVYAAQHVSAEQSAKPPAFRGPVSRTIMAIGGLLFLAHASRVIGMIALR
jgi:hypothetical protein